MILSAVWLTRKKIDCLLGDAMVKRSLSSSSEKKMLDHFSLGIPHDLDNLSPAAIESIKTLYYVPLAMLLPLSKCVLMIFVCPPRLPLFPPGVLPDFPSDQFT